MSATRIDLVKTPSFRLDGKRALVTGGGRGIGLTAASALAEAGAQVTIAARTRAEIEEAAAAIRERGQRAEALTLDVTDVEAARSGRPICLTSGSKISTPSSRSMCVPPSSWRRRWRCA